MARFIALGFLILPLVEIALFIVVGRAIGVFPTLGLIIAAAIGGGLLLRHQGLGVISRLRNNVSAGTIPGRTVMDAMLIGVAGLFLVLPGFLSDIVALALLVPAVRGWIFDALASRVRVVETSTTYYRHPDTTNGQVTRQPIIDLDDDNWRDDRQ